MRRFHFRLESVRVLRAHVERTALSALAQELAEHQIRVADLERADAAVASARSGEAGLSGPALAARQAFVERRERERELAASAAREQQQVVATRSAEVRAAAADRAALDKLRDRRRTEHTREAARAEDAVLGEVALARVARAGGQA